VRQRLEGRGELQADPRWKWVHRRAEECCLAHRAPGFGMRVPTENLSAVEVAHELIRLIQVSAV